MKSTTRLVGSTRLPTKDDLEPFKQDDHSPVRDLRLAPWFTRISFDSYEDKTGTLVLFWNNEDSMWCLHDILNGRHIMRNTLYSLFEEAAELEATTKARSKV